MSFLWPRMLWFLLAVPALLYAYARMMQWRAEQRAALGTMGVVRTGSGPQLGWRRHAPAAVFLVGVTLLLFALARPVATIDLPRREGTVILAFDVSNSMLADDLAPTRLQAAKRAARAFVDQQPETIDIGVVAFSTAAFEVLAPTEQREEVRDAIRRLRPEGATSLGRGIAASLSAIAGEPLVPDAPDADPGAPVAPTPDAGAPDESPPAELPNVPFLGSAAVILLTDGEDTTGLDPVAVADVAGRAGVRIFPIGLGSAGGAVVQVDGFNVATRLDEGVLRDVAAASNGDYYAATDSASLGAVYDSIDLRFTVEGEETEITALLAGGALVVFLVAGALSMRWLGRVP